jgi:hypothetical protein
MPTVTTDLTWICPDDFFSQSVANGDTATASYTGPDRLWVFVNNETNLIEFPAYSEADNGATIPTMFGTTKVEITTETQEGLMLLALLVGEALADPTGHAEANETLPNGSVHTTTTPIALESAYSQMTATYVDGTWTLPLRESPTAWSDILNARNGQLTASDGRIAPDMPAALKQQWVDYRQLLRDYPSTMGYGTADEVAAWKCSLPMQPVE